MKSTDSRAAIAATHLGLLREAHERMERDDRYYVSLAFTYGLTVDQVVSLSGLSLPRVRQILGGA